MQIIIPKIKIINKITHIRHTIACKLLSYLYIMFSLDEIQTIYLNELIDLHNRIQINYNDLENSLTDLLQDGFVKKKNTMLQKTDISFASEHRFISDIQKIKKNILEYFTAIYEILVELDDQSIYDRLTDLKMEYKNFIDRELEIIDINVFINKLRDHSIDISKVNYGSLSIFYHKLS